MGGGPREHVVTIRFVGVGWFAPLSIMSEQLSLWDTGFDDGDNTAGGHQLRAILGRELRYLLTISTGSGRGGQVSPAGLAHSMGVCLTEDWIMSRGQKGTAKSANSVNMPRFVDVKLTQEQRTEFQTWASRGGDLVTFMQSLADDGYRIGVVWGGEQQAYTVSLTCRNPESKNNGLCMTSYAGTLATALWLAVYKHVEVTRENWIDAVAPNGEEFG